MKCPMCAVDLLMSDRQGIEIDYCPKCRGIWLDRGEIDKIIERSLVADAPRPAPVVAPAPAGFAAPPSSAGYAAPAPSLAGYAAPASGWASPPPRQPEQWKRDDDDDDDRRRYGQQGQQGQQGKKRKGGFLSEILDFD